MFWHVVLPLSILAAVIVAAVAVLLRERQVQRQLHGKKICLNLPLPLLSEAAHWLSFWPVTVWEASMLKSEDEADVVVRLFEYDRQKTAIGIFLPKHKDPFQVFRPDRMKRLPYAIAEALQLCDEHEKIRMIFYGEEEEL